MPNRADPRRTDRADLLPAASAAAEEAADRRAVGTVFAATVAAAAEQATDGGFRYVALLAPAPEEAADVAVRSVTCDRGSVDPAKQAAEGPERGAQGEKYADEHSLGVGHGRDRSLPMIDTPGRWRLLERKSVASARSAPTEESGGELSGAVRR